MKRNGNKKRSYASKMVAKGVRIQKNRNANKNQYGFGDLMLDVVTKGGWSGFRALTR